MQRNTFTMRPNPGTKGCYDICCNGQPVASVMSRATAKSVLRQYQLGIKQVKFVEPEAAAVAAR